MAVYDFLRQCLPGYGALVADWRGGKSREWLGLPDEARLLLAAALVREEGAKILFVTTGEERAKTLLKTAAGFLPRQTLGYYPNKELLPYEMAAKGREMSRERIRVLEGLTEPGPFFAVAAAESLSQGILPAAAWRDNHISLEVGRRVDLEALQQTLVRLGYERAPLTEDPGNFSLRGGIVDVFPPASPYPLRLDFFDDELEAIRRFRPESQLSVADVDGARIGPAKDFLLPATGVGEGLERIEAELAAALSRYKGETKRNCRQKFLQLIEALRADIWLDNLDQFLPHFFGAPGFLEEYLPADGLLILDEAADIRRNLAEGERSFHDFYQDLLAQGEVLPSFGVNFRGAQEAWDASVAKRPLAFSFLPSGFAVGADLAARSFSFGKGQEERQEEMARIAGEGRVVFAAGSETTEAKFRGLAGEWGLSSYEIRPFHLEKSLFFPDAGLYVLGERDFFGYSAQKESRGKVDRGRRISTFVELREGDYVVHQNHGIGQYMGIERLTVGDVQKDYLHIRYAGADKLYIPTDQLDLLQKYIGSDGMSPKVNKLGGKDWYRTKERVRGSVKEMAGELIKLYARRAALTGYGFAPDGHWQREMEADFPYEETPDQIEAIADVKADMERGKPMDRLLCGDVGYGKTEVALRAAFKAVADGKQVAMLVPTTVLAQQHEGTFRERLERFGVRVGVLSRFKSRGECKETIDRLLSGQVDIVIGTHMLLSGRVRYKDLGLLIVDEEQRFGVAHKEKIKQLKGNVDVLAMSATPIPRTLHLSLLGVRDISIIETPPAFRQPIQTYVLGYQERVVREALRRELDRDGQIYFVHNRVENIERVADRVRELAPRARVLVGHGQMPEARLEEVMLDFMAGRGDILVCTTIVESGLDFPNVNTLIVHDADCLGLAQLYQLRGRVGRSKKQAYAYFLYGKEKILSLATRKRLAAIRDYTELGAGFKIAMRDMEIRGAGNILGPEQHGHMLSVGFDMYCQLIEEEVRKLKGERVEERESALTIDLSCSAYLPEDYIRDSDVKIGLYKRIAELKRARDIKALMEEMEDRFGSIPDSVYNLFLISRLKIAAEKLAIGTISQQNGNFIVTFRGSNDVRGDSLAHLVKKFGRRFVFKIEGCLVMEIRGEGLAGSKALKFLIQVFDEVLKREKANDV